MGYPTGLRQTVELGLWGGLVLLCAVALGELVRQVRAEQAFASAGPERLSAAWARDPRSDYARERGDYWMNVAIPARPDLALGEYRAAIDLNPYESFGWLALAQASERLGYAEDAGRAMTLAAETLDPGTAAVQLEGGNFYLHRGNLARAARHHAQAIGLDPSLAAGLYSAYWALGEPPLKVAGMLLEGRPELRENYFLDCLKWVEPATAAGLWRDFESGGWRPTALAFRQYFNYLIQSRRYSDARALWGRIARQFYRRAWDETMEPFWNGDVSLQPAFEGGLEWRILKPIPKGLEASIQTKPDRLLRLTVGGGDRVGLTHIRHGFFVEPGASYRLRFTARADHLPSDPPTYLFVRFPNVAAAPARSRSFSGTGRWDSAIEFTAPTEAHWAELIVARNPDHRKDSAMRGALELSRFSLEKAAPAQAAGDGTR